ERVDVRAVGREEAGAVHRFLANEHRRHDRDVAVRSRDVECEAVEGQRQERGVADEEAEPRAGEAGGAPPPAAPPPPVPPPPGPPGPGRPPGEARLRPPRSRRRGPTGPAGSARARAPRHARPPRRRAPPRPPEAPP